MAGVFTHFQTFSALTASLPASSRDTIQRHPEFAYFGSVGPDYLYFYKNDWGIAGQIGSVLFSLLDDLREIRSVYASVVDASDNLKDWLTGGVSGEVERNVDLIKSTILSYIAKLVTSGVDFFEEYRPPIADRPIRSAIKDWWWADIAHQHRTTDFARLLWRESAHDQSLRAYTLGYLSHFSTDVVTHPFINMLSGGPYRNQWRRHNLIERVLDTHFWAARANGERVNESRAHRLIHFPSAFQDLPEIPSSLCDFLAGAYSSVYGHLGIASGIPSRDDINEMYQIYYRYLKSATDAGPLNQPKPPDDFDWFDLENWIRDKFKDVLSRQPKLGRLLAIRIDDPRSWKAFLAALVVYIVWLTDLAHMIATLPWAAIARLGTAPVRYLLWQLSRVLYQLYDSVRVALVLAGYVHPTPEHVNEYFGHFIDPSTLNFYFEFNYSHLHVRNSQQTYHLVHPRMVKPGIDITETPIQRLMATHQSYRQDFGQIFFGHSRAPMPQPIYDVCSGRNVPYISAIDFGVALINEFDANGGKAIPNLNLDGDRGFGWSTWAVDVNRPWTNAAEFEHCPTTF